MMTPIREFELKGHLKGNPDNIITDSKNSSAALAQTDFQLYQALEILKTMAMMKGQNQNILAGTH